MAKQTISLCTRGLCSALAALGAALGMLAAAEVAPAAAQAPLPTPVIEWEAVSRFRLFADEKDFAVHESAHLAGAADGGILGAERALAAASDGKGWLNRGIAFCYDQITGRPAAVCKRDGVAENYLNPKDHKVRLRLANAAALAGAVCVWKLGREPETETRQEDCGASIERRVSGIKPLRVRVVASGSAGALSSAEDDIAVRDLLVVGMGDSIASGEGNPHRPVELADDGFCYFRFGESIFSPPQFFFAPGRVKAQVARACAPVGQGPDERAAWDKAQAGWFYAPCHRSLYGYQARTALALAVEQKHIAVTYVPLGCSGATIAEGLLGGQLARERPLDNGRPGPKYVEAEIAQLRKLLLVDQRGKPLRPIDLLLLTIGANDISFAGLVADTIVKPGRERSLLTQGKLIIGPAEAGALIGKTLKPDFLKLRRALRAISPDILTRTVYTAYPSPSQHNGGAPCPSGTQGFDSHPAFAIDGAKNEAALKFVETDFIPALKQLATCAPGSGCGKPGIYAMTFVDAHRAAFASHGLCAVDKNTDPAFDTACFKADGMSFDASGAGLGTPMSCASDGNFKPSQFRAYASRARWYRTVNDAYFAAMTYSATLPAFISASDIHDAIWGLTDGLLGGAVHPTAEGHAAMAEAALAAVRGVVKLPAPTP